MTFQQFETTQVQTLIESLNLSVNERHQIEARAARWVEKLRLQGISLMDAFMAEYGLSNHEGIALMQLAEALLRVPDAWQKQRLIRDKIGQGQWREHCQHSPSQWVNWASAGLAIAGRVIHQGGAVANISQPAMAAIFDASMGFMGRQFVLAQSIQDGLKQANVACSFDMLGEAALTEEDAQRYFTAYCDALLVISSNGHKASLKHGLSVKLSALTPYYEVRKRALLQRDLVVRLKALAILASRADIGLTIDAEESERLDLSLSIVEQVLHECDLGDWQGLGLAVQAYNFKAPDVLARLYDLSQRYCRRLCVRLVKGAYWDREIKRAQQLGLADYPVYTQKAATDIAYLACAKQLLAYNDGLFAQFATHNAHTIAAIERLASPHHQYEFQRLHGMGESLYSMLQGQLSRPCRVYAPIGRHTDLLAYLVRRLLENGANANFVHRLAQPDIPAKAVAADPIAMWRYDHYLATGEQLFAPTRKNSMGADLTLLSYQIQLDRERAPFYQSRWYGRPLLACEDGELPLPIQVRNPAKRQDIVGTICHTSVNHVQRAIQYAQPWHAPASERANILNRAADAFETRRAECMALLVREAGKTLFDAHAELREAVDFLRYYAASIPNATPLGRVVCISPWNFPLAICCGQIAAALACGNAVLAKPAEQTSLIACLLVGVLHEAGVPRNALQLLPGLGTTIGSALCADARIDGVVFTGSLATAQRIRQSLATHGKPGTPFIAETGGLNAMVVDSTAQLEQVVKAVIESAFQSAGQRCSALRCLYVQEDIFEPLCKMLIGAMDCLNTGDPWQWSTDIGPVIDVSAQAAIVHYVKEMARRGALKHQCVVPDKASFVAPCLIEVAGIEDIPREIFGPVLHIAPYAGCDYASVLAAINRRGYGLTFALHSRLNSLVEPLPRQLHVGNIYVNRNQIGAVVGTQPFGGEGLSGTGPKAGGPHYLARLCARDPVVAGIDNTLVPAPYDLQMLQHALDQMPIPDAPLSRQTCPGPTGESNTLYTFAREPVLCLGPGEVIASQQAAAVRALGGLALCCADIAPMLLTPLQRFSAVMWWGSEQVARSIDIVLAERAGAIIPLLRGKPDRAHVCYERHVCIDTTAASGNAELLQHVQ